MAAGPQAWVDGLPGAWASGAYCDPYVDYNCAPPKVSARALKGQPCDPYVNYNCLDAYLGDDVVTRFLRYYQLEWGKAAAPSEIWLASAAVIRPPSRSGFSAAIFAAEVSARGPSSAVTSP